MSTSVPLSTSRRTAKWSASSASLSRAQVTVTGPAWSVSSTKGITRSPDPSGVSNCAR
jgi:hypothetical protein